MKNTVSIIIPIYNVAAHIEKCMRSLLEQTYSEIEYLFVNDATQDISFEIVKKVVADYPWRIDQVKLLEHKINLGLPAARNTGLLSAKGEFIFHCDSDDWIELDTIEAMVSEMEKNDVDIVYSDFFLSFHKRERYMSQIACTTADDCIRAMLSGKMKFNVWNKMVRSSLYSDHGTCFPMGRSMGEDLTMIKLFCNANKIVYLPRAFYHYQQTNPNAFTKTMSDKQLNDLRWNADDLMMFLNEKYGSTFYSKEINFFKLNIKLPFLISLNPVLYELWREWFPEANSFISQNPHFSARIKYLQYAAERRRDWVIKLYNIAIVRFIYGVVYR